MVTQVRDKETKLPAKRGGLEATRKKLKPNKLRVRILNAPFVLATTDEIDRITEVEAVSYFLAW